jgi:hypothetical protein
MFLLSEKHERNHPITYQNVPTTENFEWTKPSGDKHNIAIKF